ncbi:unnamed protein product [Clonostachys solani]|uniref:Cytochrome P450 n=1 Tax=Clonostachys solani TaxID=160281 RepID=A0A9N9ZG53_9HYPO|nr:unnamed protein product [Clonostachys solani]
MYHEVWTKFSSKGLPVLVPTLGGRKEIFLPHRSIKWLLSQPSDVLGMWEAFNEMFQLHHSLGDSKYMLDTWAVDVTRKALSQELEEFIDPVREELELSIDELLGKDSDNWKTVDLMETTRMIINRSGGRFTVGLLCRDKAYLESAINSIEMIVSSAGALGFLPVFARALIGRLSAYSALKNLEKRCRGLLQERFDLVATNPHDKSKDPIDLIQRMIRVAAVKRPEEMNLHAMNRRLIMANLGFIYQVGFAATNALRNILDSDEEYDTVEILRAEAQRFEDAAGGDPRKLWTKANIAQMFFADSVARETMRTHTVTNRAMVRQVMVDGVHTDTGLALPKGTLVSVVSQPMYTDENHFPNPNAFDPFRFVKLRDDDLKQQETQKPSQTDAIADSTAKQVGGSWSPHALISTANLLIFGRGRTSCPGRFLVDFQLKMLIHHLVLNYDIKLADTQAKSPTNGWLFEFLFPPKGVKILVKRRDKNNATLSKPVSI